MSRDIAAKKAKERREKLKHVRRKQQLWMALLLVVAVAVLAAFIWLFRSDLFRIKKVEITGNKHLKSSQVEKLAAIDSDMSLIRLPVKEIDARLSKNPWIKDVEITRSFPDKLKIQIVERKAIALMPIEDGLAAVDSEGLVLERRPDSTKVVLPMIKDLKISKVKVGKKIKSKAFSNAILCLKGLDSKLRSSLSIISASSVDKLSLYNKEGVEILYGKAENIQKKNYILKKLLSENSTVKFIDIRVVSNPVIKRLENP